MSFHSSCPNCSISSYILHEISTIPSTTSSICCVFSCQFNVQSNVLKCTYLYSFLSRAFTILVSYLLFPRYSSLNSPRFVS
jgi:hypothetical protein